MRLVGPGARVVHEQIAPVQVRHHVLAQRREVLRGKGDVHLAPVDGVLGLLVPNDEAVVGGPARVRRGHRGDRAHVHELAVAAGEGLLVEPRGRKIPVDGAARAEAVSREIGIRSAQRSFRRFEGHAGSSRQASGADGMDLERGPSGGRTKSKRKPPRRRCGRGGFQICSLLACQSTDATVARLMTSWRSHPRWRMCTGLAMPRSTGPITSAPPSVPSSL